MVRMEDVVVYTDCPWVLEKDGTFNFELADIEKKIFEPAGIKLRFGLVKEGKFVTEGKRFLDNLNGAKALAIYRTQITPDVIKATKNSLKIIGRIGVGYDNLNINLLKREGIHGFNIPDYCISEVATHTSALILALERGIGYHDRLMKHSKWDIFEGNMPRRTDLLTLGIIGFGRIGKALAQRLKPFYKKIIAYDPFVNSDQMLGYGVEKVDNLEILAKDSDVVTLHCVLSKEGECEFPTYNMIDEKFFSRMKRDAFFVNAARGAIVNNEALLNALKEKKIAGAGIDVFSPENPHDDKITGEIAKLDNVIAVCHRAFLSRESERNLRKRVAENLVNFLKYNKLPDVGYLTTESKKT